MRCGWTDGGSEKSGIERGRGRGEEEHSRLALGFEPEKASFLSPLVRTIFNAWPAISHPLSHSFPYSFPLAFAPLLFTQPPILTSTNSPTLEYPPLLSSYPYLSNTIYHPSLLCFPSKPDPRNPPVEEGNGAGQRSASISSEERERERVKTQGVERGRAHARTHFRDSALSGLALSFDRHHPNLSYSHPLCHSATPPSKPSHPFNPQHCPNPAQLAPDSPPHLFFFYFCLPGRSIT
ncbi:hypothetical protein IE53DRAFT_113123 [Violaceomyces palustris]|uniref:Uncharacterized protein n=1 Tax=Violaceomyces palustris TaxID=1673888 RepID=A0ACD0NW51_9BASI|nr:hypothetical protein IE53DRAFT_113123 [Violaceomyces palustris]